jgi:hypothetical protein
MLLGLDTIIVNIEITGSGDIQKWSLRVRFILIRHAIYLITCCINCEGSEASRLDLFEQLVAWCRICPKYSVI